MGAVPTITRPGAASAPAAPYSNTQSIIVDGVNEYVIVPDSTDYDTPTAMTISMWVKGAATASEKWLISKAEFGCRNGSKESGCLGLQP